MSELEVTPVGVGMTHAQLVSKSGLYKLIMRSDKPQARAFQDWVTRVVLPAIRKTGGYVVGEEKVAAGELADRPCVLGGKNLNASKHIR
jgi:prophage antirepressor-like protein